MNKQENPDSWNQVIYFVSDIYSLTRNLPAGRGENLGMRLRRAAVGVSARLNSCQEGEGLQEKHQYLYPLISAISILETYLVLLKNQCFGVDLGDIEIRLIRLKELVVRLKEGG